MQVSRRQFFKICAGGMAGTTAAALGFAPGVALAETRQYKLLRTRETRNTCTYCSVRRGDLFKITVIRCDLTESVVIQRDRRNVYSR